MTPQGGFLGVVPRGIRRVAFPDFVARLTRCLGHPVGRLLASIALARWWRYLRRCSEAEGGVLLCLWGHL